MKICIQCGREFVPRHGLETLCSDECRYQRHQKHYKLHYHEEKPALKASRCIICGRKFESNSHHWKTCSDACRKIRRAQLDAEYYRRHKSTHNHQPTSAERITNHLEHLAHLEATYGKLPNGRLKRLILDWRDSVGRETN